MENKPVCSRCSLIWSSIIDFLFNIVVLPKHMMRWDKTLSINYFISFIEIKERNYSLSGSYLLLVSFAVGWFIDNEILIYLALRSSKSVSSLKLMLSSDETSNHTADTTQLPHATPRKVYKNSKKEKCPSSTYLFIHYKSNFGRRLLSWVDPRNVSVKTMPAQSSQTIGLRFFCWDWDLKIVAWSDPLLTCDEAS